MSRNRGDVTRSKGDGSQFLAPLDEDLALILAATIIWAICIVIPVTYIGSLRTIVSLAFLLFVPGYSLIAAFFPEKNRVSLVERAVLSTIFSLVIGALVGLGLNYTPWGIRPAPVAVALVALTCLSVAIAQMRRRALATEIRFHINIKHTITSTVKRQLNSSEPRFAKALTLIIISLILISTVALAYAIITPKQNDRFTEFYITNPEGTAANYPVNFQEGVSKPIEIAVVNHEYQKQNYTLVVKLENPAQPKNDTQSIILYSENITLVHGQTWQKKVNITPTFVGDGIKLQFILYTDGNLSAPYLELHLWIDVKP